MSKLSVDQTVLFFGTLSAGHHEETTTKLDAGLPQEGCGNCHSKENFLLFYTLPQWKQQLTVLAASMGAAVCWFSVPLGESLQSRC